MTPNKEPDYEHIKPSLADYIGYSCYFFALVSFGGLAWWAYQVKADVFEFRWSIFAGLLLIGITGVVFGIIIFRKKSGRT